MILRLPPIERSAAVFSPQSSGFFAAERQFFRRRAAVFSPQSSRTVVFSPQSGG
jgi:hypothetical protein